MTMAAQLSRRIVAACCRPRMLSVPNTSEQSIRFMSLNEHMRSERLLSRWSSGWNNSLVSNYLYRQESKRQTLVLSNSLGKVEAPNKLWLSFVCKPCGHRNSRLISRQAYTQGVVIVKCENCGRNHLIADNLNWWPDLKGMKNVEDFLRAKGETIRKVGLNDGASEGESQDTIELIPN